MKKIQNRFILMFLMLIMALPLYGCKEKEAEDLKEDKSISSLSVVNNSQLIERIENLADCVVDLFGIDDAVVLIYKDKAVVAVVPAEDFIFSDEQEKLVKDTSLSSDTKLKEAFVTSDRKKFDKIEGIVDNICNGENIEKFSSDIEKIINEIEKE